MDHRVGLGPQADPAGPREMPVSLKDDGPVIQVDLDLAALVLHPAFRWAIVESQWADHSDWLERRKEAVRELWQEYPKMPVEQDAIQEQPNATRKTTDLDDFMA